MSIDKLAKSLSACIANVNPDIRTASALSKRALRGRIPRTLDPIPAATSTKRSDKANSTTWSDLFTTFNTTRLIPIVSTSISPKKVIKGLVHKEAKSCFAWG